MGTYYIPRNYRGESRILYKIVEKKIPFQYNYYNSMFIFGYKGGYIIYV